MVRRIGGRGGTGSGQAALAGAAANQMASAGASSQLLSPRPLFASARSVGRCRLLQTARSPETGGMVT